jgi:hypothetical protein
VPRSILNKIGLCAAGAVIAAAGTAGPALAAAPAAPATPADQHFEDDQTYKGRIIAQEGLQLRDSPFRGSPVIRTARYNSIVPIYCRTRGDDVNGNDRWYLLTDGTWAWGPAYYIENVGPAPRWC